MSSIFIILLVFSFGLLMLGGFYLTAQFISIFTGAPFVSSETRRVQEMLALAVVAPGEQVVDLGSGDGRLVAAAAAAGAMAEGWEVNPLLVAASRLMLRRSGLAARSRIRWGSYFGRDFRQADVVFLYLLPAEMARLEQWLPAALRPGCRIVANSFPFPHWPPDERRGALFLYRVPSST